jgi:hypothetical protein
LIAELHIQQSGFIVIERLCTISPSAVILSLHLFTLQIGSQDLLSDATSRGATTVKTALPSSAAAQTSMIQSFPRFALEIRFVGANPDGAVRGANGMAL